MNYLEIESVVGREILDSRGNPTVEAEITLADGTVHAAAPLPVHPPASLSAGTAGRRQEPLSGQGRDQGGGKHQHGHCGRSGGHGASDIYAVDAAMIKQTAPRISPIWRKRHSGSVHCSLLRSSRFAGNAAVPFSGRCKRQSPACAYDEHPERRCTRHQHRGHAGVHDHAGGRPLL